MKKELNFDFKMMRSFLEVLHEKSFTRASRKLRLGQATISHHIQVLEDTLGARLIDRSGKKLSITREGALFRDFCVRLFDDLNNLKSDFSGGITGGIAVIAASTIPSTYILPGIISDLKKKYPDYVYSMQASDSREVVEMVKEGTAEAGIAGSQLKHPSVQYEKIYSDEIVLTGPAAYNESITVKEISGLPFVGREKGSGTRAAYEKGLNEHGIRPSDMNIVLECSTTESVKEAVSSGLGFAFVSKLSLDKELKLRTLKIINVRGFAIRRDFYLLYQKNKSFSIPVHRLVEKLRKLED